MTREENAYPAKGWTYCAFLSYSHADEKWATWLHRSLESYRLPTQLTDEAPGSVEGSSDGEPLPKRLHPVFRDREDLPAASDLGERINEALEAPRNLIVIASPKAAQSKWVNEEILAFKRMGRSNRVFCLIAGGGPNASNYPGREAEECFPEGLHFELDGEGQLTDRPAEPLAADVRPGKDGRTDGLLKLVAGVCRVGFDRLKQRDLVRRQKRTRRIAAGAVALMLLMGGLAALAAVQWRAAVRAREAERQQRLETERQAEEARHQAGLGCLMRAKQLKEEGRHFEARMFAARAVAFEGFGRPPGDPLREAFVQKLRPGTEYYEEASELAEKEIHKVWSSPCLVHHYQDVTHVAFSPDGKVLSSRSYDDTIRLWDVSTGKCRTTLEGHEFLVTSVAFSPGGKLLASRSGCSAHLFDVAGDDMATFLEIGSFQDYAFRFDHAAWDELTGRQLFDNLYESHATNPWNPVLRAWHEGRKRLE